MYIQRFYYLIFFLLPFSSCSIQKKGQSFLSANCLIDRTDTKTNILQHIKTDNDTSPFALIFLAAECPISQKYAPILRGLQTQFPQVKFIAIFAKWDKMEVINDFLKEFPLIEANISGGITVLQDEKNNLVKKIDARITPEVFLFDKNAVLIYRGAIDNWFFAFGQYRPEATEHYLADALQSFLKNEPVKIKQTNAIGCIIEK
jgi:thiol-disulfide isomerase/thioredoxin